MGFHSSSERTGPSNSADTAGDIGSAMEPRAIATGSTLSVVAPTYLKNDGLSFSYIEALHEFSEYILGVVCILPRAMPSRADLALAPQPSGVKHLS